MVEVALIAPLFFLLFFSLFEIAALFFVQTTLDSAIYRVARFGRTGDQEPGLTQLQSVEAILAQMTYGIIDRSRLHLRIKPAASWGTAQVTPADQDDIDFG